MKEARVHKAQLVSAWLLEQVVVSLSHVKCSVSINSHLIHVAVDCELANLFMVFPAIILATTIPETIIHAGLQRPKQSRVIAGKLTELQL